jgi:hypothetical protein
MLKRAAFIGVGVGVGVVLAAGAMLLPVRRRAVPEQLVPPVQPLDLSMFSDAKPGVELRLLFIHHSCGGQLFADPGAEQAKADCILQSHPNGGGLRSLLLSQGYLIHEASYGSKIGEKTDLFDWLTTFETHMDTVLHCTFNDQIEADKPPNQIVVFKSCYPNNRFVGQGTDPGNPRGPELTVENGKASLRALLPIFAKYPNTLFVYVTAPPVAGKLGTARLGSLLIRKLLKKRDPGKVLAEQSKLARAFNNWVKSPEGWLHEYQPKNVVVFDYYDILTQQGASNLSRFGTKDGYDSHPSSSGNALAAQAFVPFVNRAVRRAGLVPD